MAGADQAIAVIQALSCAAPKSFKFNVQLHDSDVNELALPITFLVGRHGATPRRSTILCRTVERLSSQVALPDAA